MLKTYYKSFIFYSKVICPFSRSIGSREGMKDSGKHHSHVQRACSVSSPYFSALHLDSLSDQTLFINAC